MPENSQDILTDIESEEIKYAGFWQRFFALLTDSLVYTPFLVLDYYNKTTWKSYYLLLFAFVVMVLYKPLMEFKYGATVGKMALKISVVNTAYQKIDFRNAVLRCLLDIIGRVSTFIITVLVFRMPQFADVSSLGEYNLLAGTVLHARLVFYSSLMLVVIDSIFFLQTVKKDPCTTG